MGSIIRRLSLYCDNKLFWSEFEENIGRLDPNWLEESLLDDLGLEYPDDAVDIDIPEVTNAETIKGYFAEWVRNTLEVSSCMDIVKNNIGRKKCRLKKDDWYINFNYTSVLEKIYHIDYDRVFHVHGSANPEYDDDLIVGHGNTKTIEELKKEIIIIGNDAGYYGSQALRNRYNEYSAEKNILEDLLKNTKKIIDSMKLELNGKKIDDIYVWGLSCGQVDMPYIEFLRKNYPLAKWHFSYFDNSERDKRKELSKKLALKSGEVDFFRFSNDKASEITQLIVGQLGIKEYETE